MTATKQKTDQSPDAARPKAVPAGVEISGVSLHALEYVENIATDSKGREWPIPGALALTGGIVPQSPHAVQFLIEVHVAGPGEDSRFGLFIAMSALFTRQTIIEPRPFIEFLNRQGAPILFPFVRELVASITSRSIHDTLTMAPIILEPLLDKETIDGIIENVNSLDVPAPAATAQAKSN